MAANIYVYCPSGVSPSGVCGPSRGSLEFELETFFGDAAEECGGGAGRGGYNLDWELADGEDADDWADRLKKFLAGLGVQPGTEFDVFPDGWEPGMPWRRVEVFGSDRWLTDRDEG